MAESGIDDGNSCTKDIVHNIEAECIHSSDVDVIGTAKILCNAVDHYASTCADSGWGCGYRNTQMLLSSLVRHAEYNEQLYKYWMIGEPSRCAIPSILKLQQHIEWSWEQGFDTEGAIQLGGKLVDTCKWIGATEVVVMLSSLRIRCQLVDFHGPTYDNGTHPELFKWVVEYFTACADFKPPLYLQQPGHSFIIVGMEQFGDGRQNLLILDPSIPPSQMKTGLIRKSLLSMTAPQYQIVAVAGIMDSESEYQSSKVLRPTSVFPQQKQKLAV